jgi:hypothetical protein
VAPASSRRFCFAAFFCHTATRRQDAGATQNNPRITKMKKCLAFSALVGSRDAWRSCSRRAVPGSRFCGRHTEVIAGIMLGLCVNGHLEKRDEPVAKKPAAAPAREYIQVPRKG